MQTIPKNLDLPSFNNINIAKIQDELRELLTKNRLQLEQLLQQQEFTWDNLILPFNEMQNRLHKFWSPISHLHGVKDSEELRPIYNRCIEKLAEYNTELGQNSKLYSAIKEIMDNEAYFSQLDYAQQMVIKHHLRDFRLSGVDLAQDKKQRFADLQKRHSQLTTKFEENVLDATQSWNHHVIDIDELQGLPGHALQTAKQEAEAKQLSGWLFTLNAPSYMAIITYADNRNLREIIYKAYVTRASDQGPHAGKFDNSVLMQELLNVRHELAKLVGFVNFADYSLATKMAENAEQVLQFLQDLAKRTKPIAEKEFAELQKFAVEYYQITDLKPWDLAYLSEKLCQIKHAISQEELRHYFPVNVVLDGMFKLVERLYNLRIVVTENSEVWHQDVKFYLIYDENNNLRGSFYVDLYARQNKRGGAWMDDYCGRYLDKKQNLQLPVAFLNCNFAAPVNGEQALLFHDEVLTLFHEFGHGLQHLLTKINYLEVSGINGVPWDAVELASQFMEYWCWQQEILQSISQHYQTQQTLPEDLFKKLQNAKNFQTGLHMLRQLEFALFDFLLHQTYGVASFASIQEVLNEVRKQVRVTPTWENDRMAHGFSHIFAGGYAAGYYSYKWAEVLASDAFARFEEEGLFNPTVSQAFLHTILEQGGARDAMDLFVEFRGRKPTIDALLQHSGILGLESR